MRIGCSLEMPDSQLVSLDAATGKERWKVQIANPKLDYTSTAAPIIVGNHVLSVSAAIIW